MSAPLHQKDFLCVSAYIRALETQLLTEADLARMIDAAHTADAIRVLQEHGYAPMEETTESISVALSEVQERLFDDLAVFHIDSRVFDLFRVRQDYHNAKVLLKAAAAKREATHLLLHGGRTDTEELARLVNEGEDTLLPDALGAAVREARETLANTGDAQKSDFILDKALYAEMLSFAEDTKNAFLIGYVKLMIDSDNAKALLRCLRMGKGGSLLRDAFIPGASVDEDSLLAAAESGAVAEVFEATALKEAMDDFAADQSATAITAFEKACDDAMTEYLQKAIMTPYGIEPVVAFIAAKQKETQNVRIIMSGRFAGLSPKAIRERMRMSYV